MVTKIKEGMGVTLTIKVDMEVVQTMVVTPTIKGVVILTIKGVVVTIKEDMEVVVITIKEDKEAMGKDVVVAIIMAMVMV